MNLNVYKQMDYGNFCVFGMRKNKPNQSQFQAPAQFQKELEEKNCLGGLLINGIKALYKATIWRYYARHKCRCSSMVEHSFRKAGVEGSTPSIGCYLSIGRKCYFFMFCLNMTASDTSAEAEEIQCRLYRNMTITQKAQLVFSAYRMGKMLSMAGIRMNNPDATEEQVWHIWARRNLGDELYEKVYGGQNDG